MFSTLAMQSPGVRARNEEVKYRKTWNAAVPLDEQIEIQPIETYYRIELEKL